MRRLAQYYSSRSLVIIGYDFHSEGGAWRSIYRYFRLAESRGEKVMLINRLRLGTFRRFLCALFFSPLVLFNGLEGFSRWEVIVACLLRKDVLIYLHDTEYMISRFARSHPFKFRFFKRILSRNPILVVSKQMEAYYRRDLGVQHCHVVREAVSLTAIPDFDPAQRHIVMVGSLDERKGVGLFSEVARLAREEGRNWRFHWVGALASQSVGDLSPCVQWWGWQDSPAEFVRKADVFFLSSVDDPLPLACLEAISLGKRCLVYRGTGVAELLEGVGGCSVMEEYSGAQALQCIDTILGQEPDFTKLREIAAHEASLPAFAEKLNYLLKALSSSP
jgi:glycosyltransferase involved in cell wall biosynthesis